MVDDVKSIISPTVSLMKELNAQVKSGELDPDFLLKLATTLKVSGMKLEKLLKTKKLEINGGVTKPTIIEDEE